MRLQGLSMDVRPEVRNSAARTLFAVVAGQGGRMSAPAWEECLWQMLFPLLRSVHHLAATSSKEEVRARRPCCGSCGPIGCAASIVPGLEQCRSRPPHACLLGMGCQGAGSHLMPQAWMLQSCSSLWCLRAATRISDLHCLCRAWT